MANDKLKAANKIVKGPVTIKGQAKYLYNYQKQFGNKYGTVPKEIIESLLRKFGPGPRGYFKSAFDNLKLLLEVRAKPRFEGHSKAIDRGFQQELGLLDDDGKPTSKNVIKEGPRARWRPLRNPSYLALTGGSVSNDQLRIQQAHEKHTEAEWKKMLKTSRRVNRLEERRERGRLALKTGIAQGLAGPLLFALSDRYVQPQVNKLAGPLVRLLTPPFRALDDALPGINSEDERRRKAEQLLIRKKKDGD